MRRPLLLAASTLLSVSIVLARSDVRHEGALVLALVGDTDGVRIEDARWIPEALHNVPPVYEGSQRDRTLELLLGFYTRKGRLLETARYPGFGVTISDRGLTETEAPGKLAGGVTPSLRQRRTLEVPFPREAFYLVVTWAARGKLELPLLGVPPRHIGELVRPCSVNPSCASCQASPGDALLYGMSIYRVGGREGPFERPVHFHPVKLGPLAPGFPGVLLQCPPPVPLAAPVCLSPPGTVMQTQNIHHGTSVKPARYQIVILGDGFQSTQLAAFQDLAMRVKDGLLAAEPYHSAQDRMEVYTVFTSSVNSGISSCLNTSLLNTYYSVQGQWTDLFGSPGWDGLFGTNDLCRVRGAIERVLPHWYDAELVVMLANCAIDGANADPWTRMVYLGIGWGNLFEITAVHEAGHSVAWLGEEYVACAPVDPTYVFPTYFPNVAPASVRNTVWWKSLLRPEEKDDSGEFAAVHECGDLLQDCTPSEPCLPVCPNNKCMPKLKAGVSNTWLGWYWGAQYGTEDCSPRTLPKECCYCSTEQGCHGRASCDYHRPAALCRMLELSPDFGYCRACEAKVRAAIDLIAPP